VSDIDTTELRRMYAEANHPYAKPGPAAVAAIEFHARVPALLDELDRLRERVKELEQLTRDTAWELDRMCAHSRLLRTEPVRQMAVAYPLAITQLAKVADALGWLKLTASLADDIDQAARALEAIRLRAAGG